MIESGMNWLLVIETTQKTFNDFNMIGVLASLLPIVLISTAL